MVGKWDARENEARADELRDLERELRRQWRARRDAERAEYAVDEAAGLAGGLIDADDTSKQDG